MKKRMRRIKAAMMTAALLAGSFGGVIPAAETQASGEVQKEFYVSPDGSDSYDGGTEATAFATIERAREAVDEINDAMTGDIIVHIAPGDYYLTETIQMDVSDSGTNGYEVIYRANGAPGSARIIGGQKVEGTWELADESDLAYDLSEDMLGKVYKIDLDEVFGENVTPEFNTLYVNGSRATMARTLNREDSERFPAAKDTYMYAAGGSAYSITVPGGTLPQEQLDAIAAAIQRGEEGCQVYGWDWDYRNWFTSTIPVTGINGNTLSFTQDPDNPAANRPKYPFGGGARFFLQGNLSFLDVQGEYHYNKSTHVLYYYPKDGEENLSEQEIIVPYMQEIFHLEGEEKAVYASEPKAVEMVRNITFEGLEVGYTEYTDSYSSGWNAFDASGIGVYPQEALQEGITQPSYCEQTEREEFRKGVFTLLQTSHITMDSLRIVNTGMTALTAWGDNDHITLQNSELGHIGFHGINIDGGYPGPETGAYSYNHLITNNVIHDVGELVGHGTGIQALQVHDSEFSHMEIYNSGRRAIFLQGAWANRTDQDANCNRYRDSHTYENHLEYLYLHDLQQDGGDDGAIFLCTLYRYQSFAGNGVDDTKPNYLNQIYMDNVGAPPSNKDFKPNCINFDMGCGGVIASNIKAVNPQHYNIRYNEGTGEVTFENVNMAYYHPMEDSNYLNFDESKMEYDKIGVDSSFPYPDAVTTVVGQKDKEDKDYTDLYFRDEFDNGLEEWWSLAGTTVTTPLYYSDNDDWTGNSFLADAFYNQSTEGCLIGKPFGYDLNKIVEIDFFDHTCDGMENGYCGMSFQYMLNSFARVDDGTVQRAIGVDHTVSAEYYSYRVGSLTRTTDVKREYGWHTFKWDYTSGTDVKMYIDGRLIATVPGDSFNYIEMGDYGMGGFNAYDNVVVYGGEAAPEPIPLPEQPEPEEPEEEKTELPGILEAEEADERPGTTQIQNITGGKALGYLTVNDEISFYVTATEEFELPLTVRYASNSNTAGFELYVDGVKAADVVLPKQAGAGQDVWTTFFETVTDTPISITAGEHTIKIKITDNNFNLDYIGFVESEPVEPVTVTELRPAVNGALKLSVGNEVTIPYTAFPENAEDTSVVWSTTDSGSVLTVTADGVITAVGEGTAEVTVTSQAVPEVTASFTVEVADAEASLISRTELGCTVTSNVAADHPDYGPEKLIDGVIGVNKYNWTALGANKEGGREDPSAYLTWDTPQTVKTIYLYDLLEANNYVKRMEIIFNDDQESKVVLENGVPDGGMEIVTLPEAMTDITKIEFHILEATAPYSNYGFDEIKVYSEIPGEVPVNTITFGAEGTSLFPGETYTLQVPEVVPSTATAKQVTVAVQSGEDVIRFTANTVDGVTRNYTITALKTGTAVIRATAANGVYADFTVTVGDKEQLGDLIMEAELLLGKFSGQSDAHKTFRQVIDDAVSLYNGSGTMEQVTAMMEELSEAMEAFQEAMSTEETAQNVADSLILADPAKGAVTLDKPVVPAGFKVEIASTSPEGIVSAGWGILAPDEDTQVEVTLRVTKIIDGTTADKTCTITVPGYGAEDVLETVELKQPEKKADKLELPGVPGGFAIEIVSSTGDLVAEDGTISWPMEDTEVTVKVRVTKISNGTYAEKDITFTLEGIAKKLNTSIEANEIDAVQGPYIVVQNNEVVNFNGGDWIRYDNVDFGDTPKDIRFHINTAVHPDWAGKKIHVMLDDPTSGTLLGTITVVAAGNDWGIYGEQTVDFTEQVSGVHTVYLVGEGGEGVGGVKEILFEDITPEPVTYEVTVENGTGDGMYAAGATVTITADQAPEGKEFAGWTSEDVELADADSAVTTFVMPEHAVTVTATYQDKEEPQPEEPARKEVLKGLVAEAEKIDLSKYPEAVAKNFRSILQEARDILNDETLTAEDQAKVDDAVKALAEAINELNDSKDDGSTDDGKDDDGKDDGAADDSKDDGSTDDGTGGSTGEGGNTGDADKAPGKTGDNMPVAVWIAAALSALVVLLAGIAAAQKAGKKRQF